jgi:hypothetical protein
MRTISPRIGSFTFEVAETWRAIKFRKKNDFEEVSAAENFSNLSRKRT